MSEYPSGYSARIPFGVVELTAAYSCGTGTVRSENGRCVESSTNDRTMAAPTAATPANRRRCASVLATSCNPSAARGTRDVISNGSQRDGTRNADNTVQSVFDGIENPALGLG